MRNQRGQFRIAVERQGVVTLGTKTAPCHVRNLTEEGLLIETDLQIAAGDSIWIECQLDEHSNIHCALLVASATPPLFGGPIAQISPEYQQQLTNFMNRLITANQVGL
jgi:hypothetical protein